MAFVRRYSIRSPDIYLFDLEDRWPALFKLRPDGKMVVMGDWSTPELRLKGAKRALNTVVGAVL